VFRVENVHLVNISLHIAGPSYFPKLVLAVGQAKYGLDVAGTVIAVEQLGQSVPGDDRHVDIEQNEIGLIFRRKSHDTESAWMAVNFNRSIAENFPRYVSCDSSLSTTDICFFIS